MGCRALAVSLSCALVAACHGGDDPVDNLPPIAEDDQAAGDEDSVITIDVLANDSDPEGARLRLSSAGALGHEVTIVENRVQLTPARDFNGLVELTYRMSDGSKSVSGRARIAVRPTNDAPVATASGVVTGHNAAIAVPLAGTDIDGDALTFEIAGNPANGTITGTAPDLTYTPANNFVGVDSFTFRARDASLASEPAIVTIDVVAGSAPVAWGQALWTLEDTAKTIALEATDADNDPLGYAITEPPQHGTLTGVMPNLTYTPAADFTGMDRFRWTATDGVLTSPVATITINVTAENDPPVADNQTVVGSEDLPRGIILSAHDPENTQLTYAIVMPPAHGTLTGAGNSRVYMPQANFHGTDSFTFTVSDGFLTSAPATVTIGVDSILDPPVATSATVAVAEDATGTITLAGTDGDGDELGIAVTGGPAHGTLSGTGSTLTYTPAANYVGADAVTFAVADLDHAPVTGTITINVTPTDDPPVLTGGSLTTAEGATVDIPLPATDIDGETLTFTFSSILPAGWASVYGSGAARQFGVCCNYNGPASFVVVASDGHTTSAPVTFNVTVTPASDPPIARDDLGIATPGQELRLAVLANDLDVDEDPITIDSVSAPTFGDVEIDGDELVYVATAAGNPGPDTFTYTISDPSGATATATVTVGIGEFPRGLAARTVTRVAPLIELWAVPGPHDVSGDGRYTALLTPFAYTQGDDNSLADVYVYDRLTNTRERISVAADGGLANGASERPSISDDGRYVAFASAASNLVAGDTNGVVDVFVRDRVSGTTVRASVGPGGAQVSGASRDPDLSADGRIVAFTSTSFQLIADDANGVTDIFVRDLSAGTTSRVSIRTGGGEADQASFQPAVSGDGRIVAFSTPASNLVTGDTNGRYDVFIHDRTTGVTERVSVSSTGTEGNNHSQKPALSFDGRFIAFVTQATNLNPGSMTGGTMVRDRQAITTTSAGPSYDTISLSGDGRYLAGANNSGNSYVRDRFAGVTHFFAGPASTTDIIHPVISRNGRYVALISDATLVNDGGPSVGTRIFLFGNPL